MTLAAAEASSFFSLVIYQARTARGITQKEFAAMCAVSQPAVVAWERGSRPILESTLEKVAAGLELKLVELLHGPVVSAVRELRRGKQRKKRKRATC
jgi:transcriptional regulator with XRE-family HTH domain